MNFLKKIQLWLFSASTSVEKVQNKIKTHDKKYNTAPVRKACVIVAIFVFILAAIVVFYI